jgi:REP element-mobilizing transposase RayT
VSAGPKRLARFSYRGCYRYFVTCCTQNRVHTFISEPQVFCVLEQMLHTASEHRIAVLAYCFMPDHLHALFSGQDDDSDFRTLMTIFRRRAAHQYARTFRKRLWQVGYYEHVLRHDEPTGPIARYIARNPVRAGLAADVVQYPYSWAAAELEAWRDAEW